MTRVPRSRRLALLTAGVLAAHFLVFTGVLHFRPPSPQRAATQAWATRTVSALLPDAGAASASPPAPEAIQPRPAAPVRRPRPQVSATPVSPEAPQSEAVQLAAGSSAQERRADAASQSATYRVAPTARLHYKVVAFAKGFELQGEGELDWRHDGDTYDAKLSLSSPLLPRREQRSTGQVSKEGLLPERFSDKSRSEEATHFQREQGKVSFSNNRPDVPLAPGAQDRLSVILQLGALLAGEPRKHPPGSTITVQTASTKDAESWVFTVEGPEQLQLPGGTVETMKLIRNPRKEFDQRVELWLAPAMDYVPVRLRLTNPNGDWVDQQWSSTDKG